VVVEVQRLACGELFLLGRPDEATKHMASMVISQCNQRGPLPTASGPDQQVPVHVLAQLRAALAGGCRVPSSTARSVFT
jgi:hypothetical protein